jgi:hypothetical protein
MKRYEQQLEIISKLEAEQKRLQNAIDDAYEARQKAISEQDKQEIDRYTDKLVEQDTEIWLRLEQHNITTRFETEDEEIAWFETNGLYLNSAILNKDQSARFTLWLMMMNEEIK